MSIFDELLEEFGLADDTSTIEDLNSCFQVEEVDDSKSKLEFKSSVVDSKPKFWFELEMEEPPLIEATMTIPLSDEDYLVDPEINYPNFEVSFELEAVVLVRRVMS